MNITIYSWSTNRLSTAARTMPIRRRDQRSAVPRPCLVGPHHRAYRGLAAGYHAIG
jgi:hypothetical protein